ncbi:MAG: serine acetyltransferase [Pseudomonadaceae bacterium]|nr:serine acetyltransferase [Pseudomonadaceae bacterium]HCP53930.1 serine acetyltransferase [Pseudomonas sp.]
MNSLGLDLRKTLRLDILRQRELLGGRSLNWSWRLWLYAFSPRFLPVLLYRLAYKSQSIGLGLVARFFSIINCILFGIEIATICRIGPGLFFPHTQGTVIGAVSIGSNAVIYQGVTLGAKDLDFTYDSSKRPIVGDSVLIGAGAKVLGGLIIGNNVNIAANAVLLESVADFSVAAGVPAKVVSVRGSKSA